MRATSGNWLPTPAIVLWELSPQLASLEEAFRELTHDNRDFSAPPAAQPDADVVPIPAFAEPAGSTR
jgi:hypothetical protein